MEYICKHADQHRCWSTEIWWDTLPLQNENAADKLVAHGPWYQKQSWRKRNSSFRQSHAFAAAQKVPDLASNVSSHSSKQLERLIDAAQARYIGCWMRLRPMHKPGRGSIEPLREKAERHWRRTRPHWKQLWFSLPWIQIQQFTIRPCRMHGCTTSRLHRWCI